MSSTKAVSRFQINTLLKRSPINATVRMLWRSVSQESWGFMKSGVLIVGSSQGQSMHIVLRMEQSLNTVYSAMEALRVAPTTLFVETSSRPLLNGTSERQESE